MFQMLIAVVAIVAGGVASLAGFGIGSLVTPLIALKIGTGLAVAGVSLAHLFGTALRFFFWRKHINKKVLISFGLTSATGGLVGALLHNTLYNTILTTIFECLLIFAGITGISGFPKTSF